MSYFSKFALNLQVKLVFNYLIKVFLIGLVGNNHYSILPIPWKGINQSINQSINVFKEKIQTVQFTSIYKHILFLHDVLLIIVIMKANEPLE